MLYAMKNATDLYRQLLASIETRLEIRFGREKNADIYIYIYYIQLFIAVSAF